MSKKAEPPPPQAGNDTLPPEMQEKMKAAKQLQDQLNAKMAEFNNNAISKNMASLKQFETLEKDLIELKQYAGTVKESDPKLETKINEMNKRMENLAKSALHDQAEGAKKYQLLMSEISGIIDRLLALIETFDVPANEKASMKTQFVQFKAMTQAKTKEAAEFIKGVGDMVSKVEQADKMKITKDKVGPKIDELINRLQLTKASLSCGSHGCPIPQPEPK